MAVYLEAKVWDLVVVDTPPSAGGIEFFTAPAQMADLIGGRLLRWLTGAGLPGREFFFDLAARPALRIADSVLGSNLLERVAQFLMDLRTTYDGVSQRAKEIERLLRRSSTVVVTTSDPAPMGEAVRFFLELPDVAGRPAAVVFNRALPVSWADTHASRGFRSRSPRTWSAGVPRLAIRPTSVSSSPPATGRRSPPFPGSQPPPRTWTRWRT